MARISMSNWVVFIATKIHHIADETGHPHQIVGNRANVGRPAVDFLFLVSAHRVRLLYQGRHIDIGVNVRRIFSAFGIPEP